MCIRDRSSTSTICSLIPLTGTKYENSFFCSSVSPAFRPISLVALRSYLPVTTNPVSNGTPPLDFLILAWISSSDGSSISNSSSASSSSSISKSSSSKSVSSSSTSAKSSSKSSSSSSTSAKSASKSSSSKSASSKSSSSKSSSSKSVSYTHLDVYKRQR